MACHGVVAKRCAAQIFASSQCGCRGRSPCPRRCGTHGGVRIQLSSPRCSPTPASHRQVKMREDRRAVVREDSRKREEQPEEGAEQAAVDANPVQMRARLRFNLNSYLVVREPRQILADHLRYLTAA